MKIDTFTSKDILSVKTEKVMKKFKLCVFFLLVIISSSNAQEKLDTLQIKTNPIVFGDVFLGYSNTGKTAATIGVNINYQFKTNLFTFRTSQTTSVDKIYWFLIIPVPVVSNTTSEFAALYGKRYVEEGMSYHFSGGISLNVNKDISESVKVVDNFIGFPFEIGVHWFKSKKKRFRIFSNLIPIGKPTAFGRSIGFKLYGNIGKRSYIGLGLTSGLGWYKKY